MARKTARGMIRDSKSPKAAIKRRTYNYSVKGRLRRQAKLKHPVTAKGWNTASKNFYRRRGCVFVLVQVAALVLLCCLLINTF